MALDEEGSEFTGIHAVKGVWGPDLVSRVVGALGRPASLLRVLGLKADRAHELCQSLSQPRYWC